MDRSLYRVAAVIATAVLAIASSDARAETGDAAVDTGTTGAEQAQTADAQAASAAPAATSDAGGQAEPATHSAPAASDASSPPAGTATSDQPQSSGAPAPGSTGSSEPPAPGSGPSEPPAPGTGASEPPAGTTPSDSGAPSPTAETAAGSTTALPESPTGTPSDLLTFSVADAPPSPTTPEPGPAPAPALLEPIAPDSADARPPHDSREDSLPELLPRVERELRSVQVQIDELQRQIVQGTPPAPSGLARLRKSLEWIAPALLALEVRLDATGRLSPHLRAILRRVRIRLRGTRTSAAGLIDALRHSGLRGPELRLLLRELESFGALDVALVWGPAAPRAPTLAEAATHAAYTQPAPAASKQSAVAAPESRASGRPSATGSPDRGGADEPPPWSPAPGSASAGPGGAFFVAGLGSLAALLIALALPRLWSRIELPRCRRYAVVFLAPLERPG
jgi:hypothetical protein